MFLVNVSIYQTDIKTKQLAEQLETILIMLHMKKGNSLNSQMSRHTYHTRYLYENYTYTNNNRNDSLQKQLEKQEAIIKRLTYDSLYIESIARTKFGMMKKDEVGFQFVDIEKTK